VLSYGRPPPKPGSQPQHAIPAPPAPLGAPPPAPPPPAPLGAAPAFGAPAPPAPLGVSAAVSSAATASAPAVFTPDARPPTPRLAPPPKKTTTQTSGEFAAVRPRLDQTVELPVMTATKERPVQVALKVDPRTFGKTWSSDQMAEAAVPESIAAAVQRASRPSLSFPAASNSEQSLLEALHGGNAEAGIQLSRLLQAQPARSHDQVAVGRSLVALLPAQAEAIELLLDAATRDRDLTYASALRHALSLFGNRQSEAPVAPPLAHQDEQPETLTKLLLGAAPVPALEALGLLVKHVPQLFRQYEPLDDTQRIGADGLTPLSQLVGALHRLLGTQKTQVLARPQAEVPSFRLLVGDPATLLVEGQGNPLTAEYRYYFGATLFASRPETLLALALPAERVSTIFDAILAAFGPPRQLQGDVPRVAQLAERLWESLPPRAQRRLQELAEQPELMHASHALQAAQASWVKAGLFASGDLHVAARDACRLAGIDPALLAEPARVAEFARQNETFAELFRFATSLEYAVLRWSQPRSRSSMQGAVER
jgi:cellulose synthase operon protein C